MEQKIRNRKGLHLKVTTICLLAGIFPCALNFFIPINPLLSILISLASAILAIVFLFWVLKPLGDLIRSTRVFADGNLNYRAKVKSGDEFEDVADSFNLLAAKLTQNFHALENDRAVALYEKNKFNEILSSIIDGIIALDFNKNIIFFNKASEEITGFRLTEVYQKPIGEFIHLFSGTDEVFPKTYCQGNYNQGLILIGKEGKQTNVNTMTAEVSSTPQTNLNCILILHDLSKEKELEQMKLDFVSMASHELKTPLTSIIGYLSVFLNENRNNIPKENLLFLDKAFIAAQQLQTLIANLLNVNKIEKEQLSVSPELIEYLPIIKKAIDDLKNQANQKNIVISSKIPNEPLPKVLADPVRTSEVVVNLLSNAINYTNAGGKIEIAIQTSPTEITTSITDNGIGIPAEAIPRLFSKFFRVSNQLQKASKGTGLGLYISKSIVEKLHGKIWVESEVGKGSRFFFTLPAATQNISILNSHNFTSEAIQSGALNY